MKTMSNGYKQFAISQRLWKIILHSLYYKDDGGYNELKLMLSMQISKKNRKN